MKNIGDLRLWRKLPASSSLLLDDPRPRRLRLEVNVSMPTMVEAIVDGDKPVFVGVVDGLDTIEFITQGATDVVFTTEGDVWYQTRDGERDGIDLPMEVSFTSIAQRRARNPELELMMFKLNQNIERRLEAQAAEFEARLAEVGHDTDTGEIPEVLNVDSGPTESDPSGTEGTPSVPAAEPETEGVPANPTGGATK